MRGAKELKALFINGGVSGRAASPSALSLETDITSARNAVDAVEQSVQKLEDDPDLNAGFGAVLNRDGDIELDAGIAEGTSGRFGGVVSVQVRHPIALAREVMEHSPHALLSASGAMKFARLHGLEGMGATTGRQSERWQRAASGSGFRFGDPENVDTVGAVALDESGRLAAGSSSGGIFGKFAGRVGDAAIFGAGFFANRWAAIVGTGIGEFFMEIAACRRAGELIAHARILSRLWRKL